MAGRCWANNNSATASTEPITNFWILIYFYTSFVAFRAPSRISGKPSLSSEMQARSLVKMLLEIFARRVTPSKAHQYMTCRGKTRNIQVNSGQPECSRRSYQRCRGSLPVVINQAAPLQPSTQKTVRNHAQNGRHRRKSPATPGQQSAEDADAAHNPAAMIPAGSRSGSRRHRFPAGTELQVVTRRAFSPKAWPTSLETVSAAASESAAAIASRKNRPVMAEDEIAAAQAVATPRLASTWDAFRPSRRSAVPKLLFALIAEPGRDPGQRENRDQRRRKPPARRPGKAQSS